MCVWYVACQWCAVGSEQKECWVVPTAKEVMFPLHSDIFFLSVSRTRRGAAQRQWGRWEVISDCSQCYHSIKNSKKWTEQEHDWSAHPQRGYILKTPPQMATVTPACGSPQAGNILRSPISEWRSSSVLRSPDRRRGWTQVSGLSGVCSKCPSQGCRLLGIKSKGGRSISTIVKKKKCSF